MKCPHCWTAFNLPNAHPRDVLLGHDREHRWELHWVRCPACERFIIQLASGQEMLVTHDDSSQRIELDRASVQRLLVHPLGMARALSPDVPGDYAESFQEAVRVLPLSTKASAALSRRLLQALIHEEAGITRRNLDQDIQALIDSNVLASDLANDVDAIRTVGNFAAHAIKSQSTGEITEVETGEAEWLIDVLEELFDFYFVRPKVSQRRRDEHNAKLQDANKPPLKSA